MLFLSDEMNRMQFQTPASNFVKMAPRENSSFIGNHTNRSKSTTILDSNDKFERGDDFSWREENDRLKQMLEEQDKTINDLRVIIFLIISQFYTKFQRENLKKNRNLFFK